MSDEATIVVAIHDLAQARAALEAARSLSQPLKLRTAPGAAAYLGAGYVAALGDMLGATVQVDCGDDAGLAMAALQAGCRDLVFDGDRAIALKLRSMCDQLGARLTGEAEAASHLVLVPGDDVMRRLVLHKRQ